MYYLSLDKDNYISSMSTIQSGKLTEADINLQDYDFSGYKLMCYKYENGELTFDGAKYAAIESMQQKEDRIIELKKNIEDTNQQVLDGLEELFTSETITGFIKNLLTIASKLKDVLDSRKLWKEELSNLQK